MLGNRYVSTLTLTALLLGVATAAANVPRAFNFQGRIPDGGEGPVNLEVKFWDADTGGQELFSELHENVPLHDGIFSIRIGSVVGGIPDAALNAAQVWLGVSVNGGQELPRTRLVSVPFSERARSAGRLVRFEPFDPVMQVLPSGAVAVGTGDPGVLLLRDGGPENPITMEIRANDGDGGAAIRMGSGPVPNITIDGSETEFGGGLIEVGNGTATTIMIDGAETQFGGGFIEVGNGTATTIMIDGEETEFGGGSIELGDGMATTIRLRGGGSRGAGMIEMGGGTTPTVTLDGADGAIRLSDSEGNVGVEMGLDLDPFDICLGGGYKEYYALKDSIANSVLTLKLDACDTEHGFPCDSRIDLWDDEGRQAIRLHSDRINEAPELAMFMGPETGQLRETIELIANSEGGDSDTGGQITLRRVEDPSQAATDTVVISSGGQYVGGTIELNTQDGVNTFKVQAGQSIMVVPHMSLTSYSGSEQLVAYPSSLRLKKDSVETVRLDAEDGRVTAKIVEITGADLAEKFPTSEEVKPGMVVAIDPQNPGRLRLARGAYNRCVAGIVSGANDFSAGAILGSQPGHQDAPPIALSGRVWCWCDASSGAIQPGDLLTTSNTPGHAMKVTDYPKAQGAIIGKAMTSLDSGRGLVLVLVSLQ
jgi:hypothetical protein